MQKCTALFYCPKHAHGVKLRAEISHTDVKRRNRSWQKPTHRPTQLHRPQTPRRPPRARRKPPLHPQSEFWRNVGMDISSFFRDQQTNDMSGEKSMNSETDTTSSERASARYTQVKRFPARMKRITHSAGMGL